MTPVGSVGERGDLSSTATRDMEKKWQQMTVTALIAEAKTVGIRFGVEGDRLRIRGPKKAEVLGQLLLERKEEVLAVLTSSDTQPTKPPSPGISSAALPPAASDSAGWDDQRAAALIAEVDVRVEAALLTDPVADKPARRNVLANERQIVRRLARCRDSFLWQWPQALDHLLERWKEWDAGRGW